jgi:hypothetical protein
MGTGPKLLPGDSVHDGEIRISRLMRKMEQVRLKVAIENRSVYVVIGVNL